jgi:hypothetical protein
MTNTFTFKRCTALDDAAQGLLQAFKECPNSENMTPEELAKWAGQHCIITESEQNQ